MKQISFFKQTKSYFGGSLQGAKRARALSTKRPIHLVLKSQKGISLFNNRKYLTFLLRKQAQTFGVKVYDITIQVDHVHLCIRIYNRNLYKGFIRAFTGIVARKWGKGLWKCLPFARILNWGKDFANIQDYFLKNKLEVVGVLPYCERRYSYKE